MPLTIKTTHVPRDVLTWWDLSPAEQRELDYINENTAPDWQGFRYRGSVYDLGDGFEVLRTPGELSDALQGWDGFQSDTFFSGIAIRYVDDYERVIVATVYA